MKKKELLIIEFNKKSYIITCSKDFQDSIEENVNNNQSLKKYYDTQEKKVLERFFIKKEVPNVLRYSYICDKNLTKIKKISQKNGIGKYNDKLVNNIGSNILIILESPHKDEYDKYFNPIAPAQGTTGRNLDNLLTNLLNKINTNSNLFKQLPKNFNVVIANPVPYQTSLAYLSKNRGIDKEVRNQVWRLIWHSKDYQQKFVSKYNDLKEVNVIINACTENLSSEVTDFLLNKTNSNTPIYQCNHPSNWSRNKNKANPFNLKKIR